jgi:hypothetical protein
MSGAPLLQSFDGAKPVARAVLALVASEIGDGIESSWNDEFKKYDADLRFARFDNCREQGYFIYLKDKHYDDQINIAFAEHRNSDDIVVYVFNKNTFNAPTLADFTDDVWTNGSKHFRYDDLRGAAKFIAETLIAFWDETAAKVRKPIAAIREENRLKSRRAELEKFRALMVDISKHGIDTTDMEAHLAKEEAELALVEQGGEFPIFTVEENA